MQQERLLQPPVFQQTSHRSHNRKPTLDCLLRLLCNGTDAVKLNEQELNFKLDTGAEVSAISAETHQSLQKPQLSAPDKIFYGPLRRPHKTLWEPLLTRQR